MISDAEIADMARSRFVSIRSELSQGYDPHTHSTRLVDLARICKRYSNKEKGDETFLHSRREPEVFVSCSFEYAVGENGRSVYGFAEEICRSRFGLSVTTGGEKVNKDDTVSGDIVQRVRDCEFLIAVMTPDSRTELVAKDNKSRSWPSTWIPFEVGMALALGKPVGLLVSDDIDTGYVERILSGRQRIHFSEARRDFEAKLFEVINRTFIEWMDGAVDL